MNILNGNYFGKIHKVIEQLLEGRNRWSERRNNVTGGAKST